MASGVARAWHTCYASLRLTKPEGAKRARTIRSLAAAEKLALQIVDLDVLSEASCRAAVDQILIEQGRIDVVVNNAGMLMTGITEAFDPDQLQRIFDPTAPSWLHVNRAVLQVMPLQGPGTIVNT